MWQGVEKFVYIYCNSFIIHNICSTVQFKTANTGDSFFMVKTCLGSAILFRWVDNRQMILQKSKDSFVWLGFMTYQLLWVIKCQILFIYIYIYIYICMYDLWVNSLLKYHFHMSQSSFADTQLNGFNSCYPTLIILFNINHLFTHS